MPSEIDTFIGCTEAFPSQRKSIQDVFKDLLKEITLCFALPKSLQGDNSLVSEVTRQMATIV